MRFGLLLLAAASASLIAAGAVTGQEAAPSAAAAAGDAEAGKEAFKLSCRGCHTTVIAPTLRGVAGRKIASVEGFGGYTAALRAKGEETWTAASLDAFLKAPAAFAPGTSMMLSVPDDAARADLVAYLLSLEAPS
ncbi:c-type cytochrome [Phenylobacterium terrae]|uniref:C-type cytochrome n=1 Tax=Phenylobacterium terrae TaxID=2665495 RepID=A0ABW4N700_9CAUL